jgi:hypothetical protein
MDNYICEYGMSKEELCNHLSQHNCVIAGSFALASFLKSNGVDPGYEPNDIDIWIPTGVYSWSFERFFRDKGFKKSNKFDRQNTYNHGRSEITSITPLFREGKEIQLIYIKGNNPIQHVKDTFDLTCCITWIDNVTREAKTLEPETTLKKKTNLLMRNDKTCARVIKYENRGFKLINNKKNDRFTKILPVYDFYCNLRGFDCDKEKRYYKPKILKTHNAAILIKSAYRNSQVKPSTICGHNKMFDDYTEMVM